MSPQLLFTVVTFNLMLLFAPVAALILFKWPRLWQLLLALHLGLLVALLDFRSDEPAFSALLLITFGLFLGFAQPKGAWRWACLLGIWIPALALFAFATKLTAVTPVEAVSSFLAVGFAFIGVYAGVLVKRLSERFGNVAREVRG